MIYAVYMFKSISSFLFSILQTHSIFDDLLLLIIELSTIYLMIKCLYELMSDLLDDWQMPLKVLVLGK